MVQITEDDTGLVVAEDATAGVNFVREIDWDGNTLFEEHADGVDTARFHHDATKHAGLV
jgi:hypothetical protein